MVLSCASTSCEKIRHSTQAQLQHQVRLAHTDIDSLTKFANEPNADAHLPPGITTPNRAHSQAEDQTEPAVRCCVWFGLRVRSAA